MANRFNTTSGRFKKAIFKNAGIDLSIVHSDKSYVSSARIILKNNYISVVTNGDIAGIQFKMTGNCVLERQLDNNWTILQNNENVIIYNLNGLSLPSVLFYYDGEPEISYAICSDWFGNSRELYVVKDKLVSDTTDDMEQNVEDLTSKFVEDLTEKGKSQIITRRGLSLVPKDSLSQYKEVTLNEITERIGVAQRVTKVYSPTKKPIKKTEDKGKGY